MDERNISPTALSLEETRLPNGEQAEKIEQMLHSGDRVGGRYVVTGLLSDIGAQAAVYSAMDGDGPCTIKVYREEYQPDETMVRALLGHSCPYVVHLRDVGTENGRFYEVYDYYKNGTLAQKGRCSYEFIRDVVIPELNEGLHFLHTLGPAGIVHGDIKPGNLFLSDDGKHVLIGDFGISSYLERSGSQIGDMMGTPEYAPRTKNFFGKSSRTPAYDYGSLGLVLVYLATGHSLFGGKTTEEISRIYEQGIRLPDSIESRLRTLIDGLLLDDERKRFDYREVKKWCQGQYIQPAGERTYRTEDTSDTQIDQMIFGLFQDKLVTVGTRRELAQAMAEHWEQGRNHMTRNELYEFLRQFREEDPTLEEDVRGYLSRFELNQSTFMAIYRIYPLEYLSYRGENYSTVRVFFDTLADGGTTNAQEIINGGLLEFFLRVQHYNEEMIRRVHEITSRRNSDPTVVPRKIYYLFAEKKQYELNGRMLESLEQLIQAVAEMDVDQVDTLAEDKQLLLWLSSLGYQKEIEKLLKI